MVSDFVNRLRKDVSKGAKVADLLNEIEEELVEYVRIMNVPEEERHMGQKSRLDYAETWTLTARRIVHLIRDIKRRA